MFLFISNPLLDLLRDSIWQFIGVIITLVFGLMSIFISVVFYQKQLRRKEVTYGVVSNVPVVTINPRVSKTTKDKVEVKFNNAIVEEVHLVLLKMWNSGNVPIVLQDYNHNTRITFEFAEGTKILDTKILQTNIKGVGINLPIEYDAESKRVVVGPLALNSKDWITFRVLLTKFNAEEDIIAYAWIKGTAIQRSDELRELPGRRLLRALDICSNITMIFCIIVSAVIFYNIYTNNDHIIYFIIVILFMLLIYIILLFVSRLMRKFVEQQEKG